VILRVPRSPADASSPMMILNAESACANKGGAGEARGARAGAGRGGERWARAGARACWAAGGDIAAA
jgi:hypothetical protein